MVPKAAFEPVTLFVKSIGYKPLHQCCARYMAQEKESKKFMKTVSNWISAGRAREPAGTKRSST